VLRRRLLIAAVLVLSFMTAPVGPRATPLPVRIGPLQHVSVAGVDAYIPAKWKYRAIPTTAPRKGIQASGSLARSSPFNVRDAGMEAYWVDATVAGVPSDFYTLAARGPVMDGLAADSSCRPSSQRVLIGRGHRIDPSDGFVATAGGTCRGQGATRWAAFVAAPAFGPVRPLGIAQSGLYYVRVSVPEGPSAEQRILQIMENVSFGGTPVARFLSTAGADIDA
jgi:hypothetical protein